MRKMRIDEVQLGAVVMADCVVVKQQHRYGWDVVFELVAMAVLAQVHRASE